MKIKIVLCATCFGALVGAAYGAVGCMTDAECSSHALCTDFCCPSGSTTTSYTCLYFGWLPDADGTCKRAATTGSDDKGYTQTTYGTCNATKRTENCYEFSTSATANGGVTRCLSCMNVGDKV